MTAKTSRSQPPKPPTQRALADPPAGARFIAQPCCLESSALKFCSSPLAAYWRSASPISSNLRPPSLAAQGRAGTAQIVRSGYAKSGQRKKRAARLCRSSKLASEMKFGGPGRRGLGARGRPRPGDLASEVTHLPACLLGKQTRPRGVPKYDRGSTQDGAFPSITILLLIVCLAACAASQRRVDCHPQFNPSGALNYRPLFVVRDFRKSMTHILGQRHNFFVSKMVQVPADLLSANSLIQYSKYGLISLSLMRPVST